jgi:hypothetical protein
MSNYLKLSIIISVLVLICLPLVNVHAQFITNSANCTSRNLAGCISDNLGATGGFFGDPTINLPQFIGNLIKFLLTLIGSVFMLLIVYAGFLWMTAGGNTEQVKKAAQTMRNSVIGLLIIIVSYALTVTVFDVILAVSGAI